MDRRGFLGSILALGASPAIVKASSLMKLAAPASVIQATDWTWTQVGIEIVPDPNYRDCSQEMIDLICRRMREAERTMREQIERDFWALEA